jgi:hypothetical protein
LPGNGAEWDGIAGGDRGLVFAGDAGGGVRDLCVLSGEDLWGDSRGLTERPLFVCDRNGGDNDPWLDRELFGRWFRAMGRFGKESGKKE